MHVVLPHIPSFIQPALLLQEIIGGLPVGSDNEKFIATFHLGTLRIIDITAKFRL